MDKPEEGYLWQCEAHKGRFRTVEPVSPPKCPVCGRKTNGGFGLPFAPVPDFTRVDTNRKTFVSYEGDNEWMNSANQILAAWAQVGDQIEKTLR